MAGIIDCGSGRKTKGRTASRGKTARGAGNSDHLAHVRHFGIVWNIVRRVLNRSHFSFGIQIDIFFAYADNVSLNTAAFGFVQNAVEKNQIAVLYFGQSRCKDFRWRLAEWNLFVDEFYFAFVIDERLKIAAAGLE